MEKKCSKEKLPKGSYILQIFDYIVFSLVSFNIQYDERNDQILVQMQFYDDSRIPLSFALFVLTVFYKLINFFQLFHIYINKISCNSNFNTP